MMGQQHTMMVKRTLLLLSVMVVTLIAASGVAYAVSKVCPSGSTQASPCSGTKNNDTLIGTSGPDYIKALSGNDQISGGPGDDTTDGGAGNDTYSYRDGWGVDTLIDSSGIDALNFSAMGGGGMHIELIPELGNNFAVGPDPGVSVNLSSGTVVEKVTGSSDGDTIIAGGATNTLQPGPGKGGASIADLGGFSSSTASIAASSDTYSGFAASGYGPVNISDRGGTADRLVLPFASTDVYFQASSSDGDAAADDLLIMTSSTDSVFIFGQVEPRGDQKGRIEQIKFTDTILAIGTETAQAQTLSSAAATGSTESRVAELNAASSLDSAEKEKRSKAAKKIVAEAQKKAQDLDEKLSPSGGENKR